VNDELTHKIVLRFMNYIAFQLSQAATDEIVQQ
jgi:hypothetical protein